MISSGAYTKKATPITIAGRRMKRWIVQSLTSASRKARKLPQHRPTASDATVSTFSLATVPLDLGLKKPSKATQSGQVIHDVYPPSETWTLHRRSANVEDLSDSSISPSPLSSNGLTDSESAFTSSSPHEKDKESPSLPKSHYDKCRCELGGNETCACVPSVAVLPSSSLPSPLRSLSPSPSDPSGEDADSIHTSSADQIPDEKAVQVEITEVTQGEEPGHTGSASHLWGQLQEEGSQWGDPEIVVTWTFTNEVEIRAEEPKESSDATPTYVSPSSAEADEASTPLYSSDGRMSLTLCNFLGAGAHGTVVSADWAEGYRRVAVKVSHKLFISELDHTEPALKNLKNELDVLKVLKQSREYNELGSNFFPELFKSWQDAKNVYFAMDLYPWNLEDLRWANADWDVSTGDKILWAAEMILGVQALHRMRILHRDIKPANIFVTSSRHIIIGDYGLAQAWLDPFYINFPTSSLKARDAPGTMAYLAPEVLKGFYEDPVNVEVRKYASYGFEADIWSLGVTICDSWCQSSGLFGIQEGDKDQDPKTAIPLKILEMNIRPAVEQIVDGHPIWHLITRMLDRNPKTRIGFSEILAHPVFAHLDWNRVASLEYTPMWNFPEVEPSKRPKPIQEEIECARFYQPPQNFSVNETDSERTKADKLDRQNRQVLRRAMRAARDWVSEQHVWIKDDVLGEYDFDWTAPEVTAEDEKWMEDDD